MTPREIDFRVLCLRVIERWRMDNNKPLERIYLADGRWLEDDSRGTWICQVGNPVRRLHEGDPEPLIEEALGRIEAIEARGRAEEIGRASCRERV